jgi:hypothetical protein
MEEQQQRVQVEVGRVHGSNDQKEKKKGKKDACLLAQAGLSSYLCRLCTRRVHLFMLGVVSTPPQYASVSFSKTRCDIFHSLKSLGKTV